MVAAIYRSEKGYTPYGGALLFWRCKDHESIIGGPYDTGKTLAALNLLNLLLAKYPGSQALMVRQTYKSLLASAIVTYEKKVLPIPPDHPRSPVVKYGKSRPEWYDYPNGSRLYCGGMDNPDKFLSSEFDFIYINQAEEIKLDAFEKLAGRASGRAGNAPYARIFGDCNPDAPTHWIRNRPGLKLITSRHEDNPTIFNRDGTLTKSPTIRASTARADDGSRKPASRTRRARIFHSRSTPTTAAASPAPTRAP
jgi:phage terminase large subunit